MSSTELRNMLLAAAGLLPLLLLAATACGSGGPKELEVPVRLEQGKLSPGTIRVTSK